MAEITEPAFAIRAFRGTSALIVFSSVALLVRDAQLIGCGERNFWITAGQLDRAGAAVTHLSSLGLMGFLMMLGLGLLLTLPVRLSHLIVKWRGFDPPALWVQGIVLCFYVAVPLVSVAQLWFGYDCANFVLAPGTDWFPAAYGIGLWGPVALVAIMLVGAIEAAFV